jgi:iron complex transport system substrate-binding protein
MMAGAALAGGALPSTSRAQNATPQASPAGGEWTFTDDRGITVTLPRRPERIVADLSAAAPLWDFGIRPLAVSGWTLTSDPSWGNVDRSTPTINAQDDLPDPDNEKLIELQPDLFVSITWTPDDPSELWSFSSADNMAIAESIVPIVAISATGMADANLARFAELAGLLGVDLDSPEIAGAREEYDAAVSAFQALTAEKADVATLFASVGDGTEWYAAYPPDWADLAWYRSLGLKMVDPAANPGEYWETLSREQAVKYPADVFFNSTRVGIFTPEQLQADTTFALHPAIAAGQIGAWNQDFIMSYQGMTEAMEHLVTTLNDAEKVI